jgi:hypothetical protein
LVDLQLDAQNSYLFTYNTFIERTLMNVLYVIDKSFVYQVGDQSRLYYDAGSINHQEQTKGLSVQKFFKKKL